MRFCAHSSNGLGMNAFHWACCEGSFEIVKYLIKNTNMDLNIKSAGGTTGFMFALHFLLDLTNFVCADSMERIRTHSYMISISIESCEILFW